MAVASRVVKNTGYLYIKTLVSMFVMLYVTRIVLRTLGAEDFGIYDVVGGAIAMLGFLNTSMANTVQRYLNNAQGVNDFERQKRIFSCGVTFHIVISIIVVIVLLVAYFILFDGVLNINKERTEAAKIVYACLIVNSFFSIITVPYDASINAHEDMLIYASIGVIDIFLKLGVAITIMHTTHDKLILYGVLMMIVPIATYLMMKLWCIFKYKECRIKIREYYDKSISKEMLSFAGWSFVGTSSNVVGNYGNSIVLNHFFGTTLNTVAGIANQFQGMLIVLSNGMLRSLNPIIYKTGSIETNKMMEYSYKGCKYSYNLLSLLAFPIIIETPYVLELWLGNVPEWTVLFVRLQLLRCLLEQMTTTFDKSLAAVGKIKEYNMFSLVFNLLPIVLLFIAYSMGLPPYWHFIVAIFFMVVLVGVVKVLYCFKYCGLELLPFARTVLVPCIVITCIAIPLLILLHISLEDGIIRLLIIASLNTIIIFCVNLFFMSEGEKNASLNMLRSVVCKYTKNSLK